jgi:uncharacterized OsmC-like protein
MMEALMGLLFWSSFMSLMHIRYQGKFRTQATHLDSQNKIITDAPKDNQGNGEAFSPTDLLSTSLDRKSVV